MSNQPTKDYQNNQNQLPALSCTTKQSNEGHYQTQVDPIKIENGQLPQQTVIVNGQPPQETVIVNGQPCVVVMESQSAGTALCLLIAGMFFSIFHIVNACLHINSTVPKEKLYAQVSLGLFIVQTTLFLILYASGYISLYGFLI